jgi:hypothetical protein
VVPGLTYSPADDALTAAKASPLQGVVSGHAFGFHAAPAIDACGVLGRYHMLVHRGTGQAKEPARMSSRVPAFAALMVPLPSRRVASHCPAPGRRISYADPQLLLSIASAVSAKACPLIACPLIVSNRRNHMPSAPQCTIVNERAL